MGFAHKHDMTQAMSLRGNEEVLKRSEGLKEVRSAGLKGVRDSKEHLVYYGLSEGLKEVRSAGLKGVRDSKEHLVYYGLQ